MRELPRSTTYTLPPESVVMPKESLNCPLPEPEVPHCVMYVPVEENFWMRLLPESTTYTFPEESVVRV